MAKTAKRKPVGTLEERFLAAVALLQDSHGSLVNDRGLREHLNWSDVSYNKAKDALKRSAKIEAVHGGPGGSVRLAFAEHSAKRVFISYSHVDEDIHRQLVVHLQPLCRKGLIEIWHDQLIKPGQEWEAEIWNKLDNADVIILLISADFIASDFCYRLELERAFERHKRREATVISVIARTCLWKELPLQQFQVLPDKGLAIKSHGQIDDALTNVVSGISKLLTEK